jgi:hypothetical protein
MIIRPVATGTILHLRSWVFWDITERRLTVTGVSGQAIDPHLQESSIQAALDCLNLEDGIDTLSRNSVNKLPTNAA